MTTRFLSSRALRLTVASLLVIGVVCVLPPFLRFLLVGFALAWFIVPGDRRWFVPASLLLLAAWHIWPRPSVQYVIGDRQIIVHRLTGKVDVAVRGEGWRPATPVPPLPTLEYLGITGPRNPPRHPLAAADTFAAAVVPSRQ